MAYIINDECIACGACVADCPVDAISGDLKQKHTIDQSKCVKCGLCKSKCKFDAIVIE